MGVDAAWAIGMQAMFATMAVDGVLTMPAPNNTPLDIRAIWLTPEAPVQPFGQDLGRVDPKRVLAIQRTATLPSIPRGSVIVAPETEGGTDKTWRVEGVPSAVTADEIRVFVVER